MMLLLMVLWAFSAVVGIAVGMLSLYTAYSDYTASRIAYNSTDPVIVRIALGVLQRGAAQLIVQASYLVGAMQGLYAPECCIETTTMVLVLGAVFLTAASAKSHLDRGYILRQLRER